MCKALGALLLIDDSIENALSCASGTDPVHVLLFGDYQWNKRLSSNAGESDKISFEERLKREDGREFWKDDEIEIPDGPSLRRVKDWSEVVQWIKCMREVKIL